MRWGAAASSRPPYLLGRTVLVPSRESWRPCLEFAGAIGDGVNVPFEFALAFRSGVDDFGIIGWCHFELRKESI